MKQDSLCDGAMPTSKGAGTQTASMQLENDKWTVLETCTVPSGEEQDKHDWQRPSILYLIPGRPCLNAMNVSTSTPCLTAARSAPMRYTCADGHYVPANLLRCVAIYRPLLVDAGSYLAVPARGNLLLLLKSLAHDMWGPSFHSVWRSPRHAWHMRSVCAKHMTCGVHNFILCGVPQCRHNRAPADRHLAKEKGNTAQATGREQKGVAP
eukprot:355170-Pelagomonas_calceolata.AAC.1